MKKLSIIFLVVLIAFMLPSAFAGCVQKPEAEVVTEWDGKDTFEPSDDSDESILDLYSRYEMYKQNVALAFSQNQPASEDAFEYEDTDGGVEITAYVGNEIIVVIPEMIDGKSVVSLSGTAFANSTVRAVSVPDCVERIEKGAFAGCDNISTLRLPFVGDGGEINHFGHIFGSDSYENHAVKVPASLDMVILGDKTAEIAENAFAGCKSVSAIALPESVENVGAFAFYECKDLVYITSLNSVKEVGSYAFGYCSSLLEADFSAAESFDIGAFYECNSLRKLVLPFVGGSAEDNRFIGYIFGAESADYNDDFVPASLYEIKLSDTCFEIPDRAFADCPYIANFIIPESVEKIGARAFYSCRSIRAIELPNAIKTIGDDAFFGCDNLKSIEFGDGVESIGMQAFYGCRALEAVEIPEKITEIMPSTFALCESLKSVSLNNVKKVGKDAFWGCSSLIAVDCSGIDVAEGNSKLVLTPNDDE